jgi:hypothetical protein
LIGDLLVKFANIVPVAAAMLLIGTGSVQAESTTLALWTMPTAFPTGAGLVPTGTSYRPPNGSFPAGTPDQGLLAGSTSAILSTFHALAAATYTSPAGNGSQYSFSGNNWSPNDFYQVVLPTTGGWTNLSVSWDQARSSTGPASFSLQTSIDGSTFTTGTTYTVLQSGGGGAPGTWSTTTYNSLYSSTFALPSSVENQTSLYIRFLNTTGSVSASSGSNRIDNVSVTAVPEPSTCASLLAGLACGGYSLFRRRRAR